MRPRRDKLSFVAHSADLTFPSMGTTAHVIVVTDADDTNDLLEFAQERIDALEARWTRFDDRSELTRLNATAGTGPAVVSADTFLLVQRAVDAWELTHGRFDPTVLPALMAAGYDRDFDELAADAGADFVAQPAPGCAGVRLDTVVRAVTLPAGVSIDSGGIGKGLAADVVTAELLRRGAVGACVNLGGDLRVRGVAPGGGAWTVGVDHPLAPEREVARVQLTEGAVASTWRTKRVWGAPGHRRHHLIDPRAGASTDSGFAGVTVLVGEGWGAEALAKAVYLAGPADGAALVEEHRAAALLFTDDGDMHEAGAIADFLVPPMRA